MRRTLCSIALITVVTGCTPIVVDPAPAPTTSAGGFPCPPFERPTSASPEPVVQSGRVQVGKVSYPAAPAPYSAPSNTEYMAFANLIGAQHAQVEQAGNSSLGWNSVVALARLSSGDGAWGAQRAAEVVSQCSLSVTWLGIDYHPQVRRDEPLRVDGHPGWIRVTDLSFAVPGIRATREVQTVVIVQPGNESYAYLSYLPDSAEHLKAQLDATRDGLRVS
jgi:hypothetical protein